MKLCSKCARSFWPFFMVFSIAGVTAFETWVILGLSMDEVLPRAAAAAVVFLAMGGTMLHYVIACLKRHCHHGKEHALEARLRQLAPSHNRSA